MSKFPLDPGAAAYEVYDFLVPQRKVNQIVKFFSHPCAAPWYIYVELLAPAFLEAFITYVQFGQSDMIRMSAGRAPTRWTGRLLRGMRRIPPTRTGNLQRWFWKIDAPVQRLLWWWMVADIALDGVYNWTTMLQRTEWCTGGGIFQVEEPLGSQACGPSWGGFWLNNLVQNTVPWAWNFSSVTVPAGDYHCILVMEPQYNGIFNQGSDFEIRLAVTQGFVTQYFESGVTVLQVGARTQVSCGGRFHVDALTPATIQWQWRYWPGAVPLVDHGETRVIVAAEKKDIQI